MGDLIIWVAAVIAAICVFLAYSRDSRLVPHSRPALILWLIAVAASAVLSEILYRTSLILLVVFLVLIVASVISVAGEDSVIPVRVKAKPVYPEMLPLREEDPPPQFIKQETELTKKTDGRREQPFSGEIPISAFMPEHGVRLFAPAPQDSRPRAQSIRKEPAGVWKTFTRSTPGVLHIESGRWHITGAPDLHKYLKFQVINIPVTRRVFLALAAIFSIGIGMVLFSVFRSGYQSTKQTAMNCLNENLAAASQNAGAELLTEQNPDTAEARYFTQTPPVHLLVISKESDRYIPADPAGTERYMDPTQLNTVLMFYEDNLSGRLHKDAEPAKNSSVKYYNFTELYLNLPIRTQDRQTHMLGELFGGSLTYRGETGFPAVKAWFREQYYIEIASVTVVPQTVFSELYGNTHTLGISVHKDFARFLRDNYCDRSPYRSAGPEAMLRLCRPIFSGEMQNRIYDLCAHLGTDNDPYTVSNAVLPLSGGDIISFGNTVRSVGDNEYNILAGESDRGDAVPTDSEPEDTEEPQPASAENLSPEEQFYQAYRNGSAQMPAIQRGRDVYTIMHSNWDILLADLCESITSMNNSVYPILCTEHHAAALSGIRSSLPKETLSAFLTEMTRISPELNENPSGIQMIFSVRNLQLDLSSELGKTNVYLLGKPLIDNSNVNDRIKSALFFCLSRPKEE